MPSPFLVMATQNPIESEGTYPLPEAQVDRFMLKVLVDYPAPADELTVIERALAEPVVGRGSCSRSSSSPSCRRQTRRVYVDPAVSRYALAIAIGDAPPRRAAGSRSSTRYVEYGASPRGPINLVVGAARSRAPARPPLRAAPGRPRARQGRAPPPPGAQLRGARRGRRRGRDPRPRARDDPDAAARPRPAGGRMSTVHALRRPDSRPSGPGPGSRRAPAHSSSLTVRRRIDGLLAGDHRSWATRRRHRARAGAAVHAGRRRPHDRLERDRPHRRAARPRQRRRARGRDVAPARHVGVDDVRHRRPAEVGRRRGRLARRRALRRRGAATASRLATFGDRRPRRPRRRGRATAGVLAAAPATLRREPDLEPVGPTSLGARSRRDRPPRPAARP